MNLQRLSPKPSGQGSRAAIDTQSDFRKRSQLNAEMVSFLYYIRSKRQSTNGKEFDTYKVGTVANSTSTMHKLASTPITLDCFDTDMGEQTITSDDYDDIIHIIGFLEELRKKFNDTKDKRYWRELIQFLPESWIQKRTVTLSYENVYAMIRDRHTHKLHEWSGKDDMIAANFIDWAHRLPYAEQLLFIGLEK